MGVIYVSLLGLQLGMFVDVVAHDAPGPPGRRALLGDGGFTGRNRRLRRIRPKNDATGGRGCALNIPPARHEFLQGRETSVDVRRWARDRGIHMTTVGLVLGVGGLHAAAQHAGVLAALSEATGWDPRTADVVVGTSAGATTAVSLRAGVSATDLPASYARTPLSDEGQDIMNRVTTPLDLGSSSDGEPLDGARRSSRRPANLMLLLRDLCLTARPRPVMALAGLLPVGTRDGSSLGARSTEIHP